jgi:predicted ATPase/DNA-binding SARP family transcriptional activator
MARLACSFLGTFQVTLGEKPVTDFVSDKARALLAYLAVERNRPHRRETLAGLLWPDRPQSVALNSLRQALFNLRRAIGDQDASPPILFITRHTVQFNPNSDHWLDVTAFIERVVVSKSHPHHRLETCGLCIQHLHLAAYMYRGNFLEGLNPAGSLAFEEWALLRREWLHGQGLDVLQSLADYYEQRGDYEQARDFARRQIELDPWREEAHQQLMRVLALSGERSAALAQYETCRLILGEELGTEPAQETIVLYRRIWAGEMSVSSLPPAHTLPIQLTPFIGREKELAQIAERLNQPGCRLLTLIGPGGIGKTRLAIQVAADKLDHFADGVYFVPLASFISAESLASAMADAVRFSFLNGENPEAQLVDYLREKEMFLVLDGFEHLLQGADLVLRILRNAPRVTILLTSQQRLGFQAECLFEIKGLAYAESEQVREDDNYSAVELFVERARRARADFALTAENTPGVMRICRLVEGMPLGIELAAARVGELSCEQIAREIERSLDFLATDLRDVPERHRSLRAVFEHSWNLLAEKEKNVLSQLAVFRGDFQSEAAELVVAASPSAIAGLVEKSFLSPTPAGCYHMHAVLRKYAAEKLVAVPEVQIST